MSLNPPFLFSYNVPDNLVAGETLDLDGLLRDDHNDSEDHSGISERAQPAGGDENGNYGHEDASAAGHDSADGAIDGHSRDEAAAAAPGRVRPKACDSCYKLRIRCSLASLDDTVMPEGLVCESCAALNCACTFTRAVLARGPKKGVPRAPQRRKTHRIGKKTHRKVVGPKAQAAEHAPPSRQPADLQNGPGADDTGLAGECLRQNVTVDGEGSILGSEEEFQLWLGSGRDLGFLFPVAETNTAALDAPVLQYPSKTIEDTELVPAIARHVALDPPNLIGVRRNDQHAVGSNLPVSPAFVHSSSTVPSETAHVVHVGREIGPFESLDPLPSSEELLRSVQDFFVVNNINSGMKIIHYKSFFLSMSSQTGCNLFLPNGHYAVPPPLPLFLAMASIGIVLESSQVISTAPSVSGPSAVAPFAAPNLTIPQGYGSPSSSTANSRSMSNNLARYAWTLVQPWLETLQRAADSVAAPLALLDPAALTVLLTLRTLLWRSGLFLRLDASRNLLNAAISLAFRLGCGNPRSLIVPPLRGNPTGAQLYAYYKSQLIAESIRRAFWSLYIHDRTLAVLDAGPFVIPDEVAWEMNLPCLEADFDLVSETLVAIEVGMEAVAPELREQLLNSVHWEVLPRDLLWKPFRAHRVMGNPLPADPIQKRFTANIAVTFVIGKANAFHVHARSLGVELFDPRCDPASPPVRSLVVELQRTVARIRGFFDKLPDWYMELDADPVGFVERQLGLPLENRLPIDTVYAGCTDLLILRLACVLVHGPAKPDPTDPAHIAWLTLARNSPNHLWSIAQTMPPLHDYPDLSKRPRYPLLPICAVEGPEYSVLELCLHHTLRMIGLFRALALVDPLGVRHSVLVHHAVVQAAVYRVVLALGCVTQDPVLGPFEAGSRPTGSLDQAFEEALVDVEFIESQLATFKTTHVAKGLSKEVVSAVKKQLIEWRVQLVELQAEPAVYSASLGSVQGSPRGSAASRSFAEDADDAGDIETITTNAARSGFLSEGMAALIARMGSGWNT